MSPRRGVAVVTVVARLPSRSSSAQNGQKQFPDELIQLEDNVCGDNETRCPFCFLSAHLFSSQPEKL
ncbi:unnamed protein product [Boreogadus saida]